MDLGLALTEETLFDERSARIMNLSLAEYHVPVHMDVPAIEIIWNDIPDRPSPMGTHGIGEIGNTGVGAAVANAVYNATGIRIRELPITLARCLQSGLSFVPEAELGERKTSRRRCCLQRCVVNYAAALAHWG